MVIRAKATVRLKFQSDMELTSLINALKPESKGLATRRAKVRLKKAGSFLLLTVEADDTVALRAMLNAYLRWISSAVNVIELIEQEFSN